MKFEVLPHTADKEIRAFGSTPEELFENAAFGMFSLMAELDKYTPSITQEVQVDAVERDELLRTWLAELLFSFEVDRILFVEFHVTEMTDTHMEGYARGLSFSPEIEWLGSAVKAVTHHGLNIRKQDDHWEAEVVFDV